MKVKMYGVFRKGGSIGRISDSPVFITEDKELAKSKAKMFRSFLSPGERSYYKMSYVVRPYNDYVSI